MRTTLPDDQLSLSLRFYIEPEPLTLLLLHWTVRVSVLPYPYVEIAAIDPRDHSGYYGLGSMYDILKMPAYALQYFQLAHQCRFVLNLQFLASLTLNFHRHSLHPSLSGHKIRVCWWRLEKCTPVWERFVFLLQLLLTVCSLLHFSLSFQKSEAEQCFLKAYKVGDVEGNALVALARFVHYFDVDYLVNRLASS